jgi:predicted HAD superfamily Cof-like phosphohydrolase
MSYYQKVKEFTEESLQIKTPSSPQKMSRDEVKFLISMVLSELTEIAETVTSSPQEAQDFVSSCIGVDSHSEIPEMRSDQDLIVEQLDGCVDAVYYILNACAKKGMNFDLAFDEVHRANLDKRDPITGNFIRRESDGKIMKPPSWKPRNLKEVLFPTVEVSKLDSDKNPCYNALGEFSIVYKIIDEKISIVDITHKS